MHEDNPEAEEYLPTSQLEHSTADDSEILPASHATHAEAPDVLEYVPAWHALHPCPLPWSSSHTKP